MEKPRGVRILALGPAIALTAACGPAVAGDLDAAFQILRQGKPIGHHVVDVEQSGDLTIVNTLIEMRVRFGPIALYRYDHEAREVWTGGALVSIESRTDDNGAKSTLAARLIGDRLVIDGSGYKGPAPPGVAPSSYWNRASIGAPLLLNTQNGELVEVETTRLGVTATPDGAVGEQYRIVGTVALNIWFDGPRWVASNFTVDGEELTYAPIESGESRERLFARLGD